MALDYAHGTSDRVVISASSSLNNLNAGTVLAWVYNDGLSNDNSIFTKDQTDFGVFFRLQTNNYNFQIDRATTNLNILPSDNQAATGTWQFVAMVFDINGADGDQKCYMGSLSSAAAEVASYGTQTAGSGTRADDSDGDAAIGNWENGPTFGTFDGRIAWVGVWNAEMTLAQIRAQQYEPHKTSGCVGFWHLGYNSTGTQPDWSGNRNNGTVTGATVANHVPLALPIWAVSWLEAPAGNPWYYYAQM